MKKVIMIIFNFILLHSVIVAGNITESLKSFCGEIVPAETTVESLIEKYGEPNSIQRKKTGYLEDAYIYFLYDEIGTFTFFYKSDENVTKFCFFKINENEILKRNIPVTIDEIRNIFNYSFTLRILENKNLTILGYYGDFTVNFQFRENKLIAISWSIL